MQGLTDPPRDGLTEAQVRDSLSWTHSTKIRWHVSVLNFTDLSETGITLDVTEGSVTWAYRANPVEGQAPVQAEVRRTGNLSYRHVDGFNPLSVLYRPVIEMQGADGVWVPWYLGVFMATMPPYEYEGFSDADGPVVMRGLELADRSHLWASSSTQDPVVVPAGTEAGFYVFHDLQARFREHNFEGFVTGFITLAQDYVFDAGTPWLEVYNTLLAAIGQQPVHVTADGGVVSFDLSDPEKKAAEWDYTPGTTVLAPARVESVNPELPNVLRFVSNQAGEMAIEGEGIRTVINEATGPASRQARGGQTVLQVVEVDAETQDDLDKQARAQAPFYFAGGGLRYTGQVGLNPAHGDDDVVFLDKPALGITGNWLVTQWTINLGTAEDMATMDLELEHLTGASFVSETPVPVGAYGSGAYGTFPYGMP